MVIPIEDSAYEKLQQYIESLRRYFVKEEGRDEIINDIEGRIAELMNDKIKKGATAVTDEDIDAIITSMGRVEDFESADLESEGVNTQNTNQGNAYQQAYTEKKSRGRLYRDQNDKFIGGVCSGIANYLDVDPTIVRILFAILFFATGVGFLAYIILWIVLPSRDLEGQPGKRLYRNPDDRILGGVAGGLAAYFNKSAKTIRLIFAAPILLSVLISVLRGFRWNYDIDLFWNIGFGSFTGTFILIYVILWIILPEANTDYEKMEMRGETVDINRIRQNVKAGMGNMKGRMQEWSEEVKESAQNLSNKAKEFSGTRGKAFAAEVNQTVRRSGNGIGHAIAVLFKVFLLFIAGCIAFGLFMALLGLIFGVAFGGIAWGPVNNFIWTSQWQQILAWSTLVFFFIVPLVAFIVWLIRRLSKVRSKRSYLGWTFGGLWTLGWVALILFITTITKDFRDYEHADTSVRLEQPGNGKLIVAVSQPALELSGRYRWLDEGIQDIDLSSDTLRIAAIDIDIKASTDDQYHASLKKYAFGRSVQNAMDRAEKIRYSVISRDSVLDLANSYAVGKENKFRFQNVVLEVQVPIGKKIRFDESLENKLNIMNFKVRRTYRRNRIRNFEIHTDRNDFNYRTGIDYTMGADGELTDGNGKKTQQPVKEGYRYKENDTPAPNNSRDVEIQKQIDEEKIRLEKIKRENEESQQKIKDLEEKKKTSQQGQTNIHKSVGKNNDSSFALGPSGVSSIAVWF